MRDLRRVDQLPRACRIGVQKAQHLGGKSLTFRAIHLLVELNLSRDASASSISTNSQHQMNPRRTSLAQASPSCATTSVQTAK